MTRRRPPRRRTRRPGKRQQQRDAQLVGLLVAAGAAVMIVRWLAAHWWIVVVALVLAALAGAGWLYWAGWLARRGMRWTHRPVGRTMLECPDAGLSAFRPSLSVGWMRLATC